MNHDRQTGREPRRLRSPVTDDRGRSDHERRAIAARGGDVGEDGWRLAETHVEGEASAEADGVEEAEPGERLGLIAAQLAVEPGRRRDRLEGDVLGFGEDVCRPTRAFDLYAASEWRTFEPDGLPQDLGARERRFRLPLGEGGRSLGQVGAVELDPLAA